MEQIQPIGGFLPQDKNGFIINELSLSTIDIEWQSVIEKVVSLYQKRLSESLHSVYVRGSVATGRAIKGISDLDTFALVYSESFIRWNTADFQPVIGLFLKKEYPFINTVEANIASFHNDFYKKNPRLAMIIKTQSICVSGLSIIPELPSFRPNRLMCLNITWLEEDVGVFLQKLEKQTNSLDDCQAIMKVIIRSGFELIIEKEKQFTADLYLCYLTFSKYYPTYQSAMKQALFWYVNPIRNQQKLCEFVTFLSSFIIKSYY